MTKTPTQLKSTDEATRNRAIARLKSHLNVQAVGYACTTAMVRDGLIRAAVTRQTIETVCHSLAEIVDGETIRDYNPQLVRTAEIADVAAILLVRGKMPLPETVELAQQVGILIVGTQLTMFETCGRLYAAGLSATCQHNGSV